MCPNSATKDPEERISRAASEGGKSVGISVLKQGKHEGGLNSDVSFAVIFFLKFKRSLYSLLYTVQCSCSPLIKSCFFDISEAR